jgi:flagellar hook protein FlgE
MAVLQMKWTEADIQRMVADAMAKQVDSQVKMVTAEAKAKEVELKAEKQQADLDKTLSETMKNLSDIDANEAEIAMKTLDHARADVEMELEAQGQMTERKNFKVMDHPDHGEVTEADIQKTMQEEGLTRDQVLQALSQIDVPTLEQQTGGGVPNAGI